MATGQFTAADVTPPQTGQTGQFSAADVDQGTQQQEQQPSVRPSDARTIPNARIRNLPNPVDPSWGPGRALYEGAKTGLMVGSLPAAAETSIPALARGTIGAALGGYGAKKVAKVLGAGEFGQEAAGDVSGLITGGLAAGLPETRVGSVVGKVAKGTFEDIPGVRQFGKIAQYWKESQPTGTPLVSDVPLGPEPQPEGTPLLYKKPVGPPDPTDAQLKPSLYSPARTLPGQIPPEVVQPPAPKTATPIPARGGLSLPAAPKGAELSELPAPKVAPTSQADALGQPVPRGTIAKAVQPETQPIRRGSLAQMLQDQLDQSLGAKKLDPTKPLRNQLDTLSGKPAADVPEGHTPVKSSALQSYKYDPATREFHARYSSGDATTHVFGDVDPDEAQAFEGADSKGKAMQQIKQGHPLVAKIVNGKRMPITSSAR